jgi:putative transposase
VRLLCTLMDVHRSGYYAWKNRVDSPRQIEDRRLLGLIKQSWLESSAVYGYRKVHCDLRELGERCGKHRVARLMHQEGLRSQSGYRRRSFAGKTQSATISPNHLQRQLWSSNPERDRNVDESCDGWRLP